MHEETPKFKTIAHLNIHLILKITTKHIFVIIGTRGIRPRIAWKRMHLKKAFFYFLVLS